MKDYLIQGKWKEICGTLKVKWGELTDDDLEQCEGHKEYLIGKLQEYYGWSEERAEEEVKVMRIW